MPERKLAGVFNDIAIDAAGVVWIVREVPSRTALIVERDGVDGPLIPGQPAQFPRIDASGPVPIVAFQCSADVAVWIDGTVYRYPQLGTIFANAPVAIVWNGAAWLLASVTSQQGGVRLTLSLVSADGTLTEQLHTAWAYSDGIFSLTANGTAIPNALAQQTGKRWTAGGLTVREGSNPDRCIGTLNGQDFDLVLGYAAEPHCIQKPDGSYLVAARGLHGNVRIIDGPPWPVSAPSPAPTPQPIPPFVPAKVSRYYLSAWFKPGTDSTVPAHAVIPDAVSQIPLAFANGYAVIPDTNVAGALQEAAKQPHRVPYVYVAVENDIAGLIAACEAAQDEMLMCGLDVPFVTYSGPANDALSGTIPGYQFYLEPGESVAQLVTRFKAWAKNRSSSYAIIAMGYDRNDLAQGTHVYALADIVLIQAVAAALADADPKCVGCFNFAWQRVGGAKTYPELEAAARAQFAAIPAKPTPTPVPTPTPIPVPPPEEPMPVTFPPRNETREFFEQKLNPFYRDEIKNEDGTKGRVEQHGVFVDTEGIAVWTDVYLHHRVDGMSHQQAMDATMREVAGLPPA